MTSFREKVLCKTAQLPTGQILFTLVSHMTLLFCLTLIGQSRSHDLIKLPLQFSTELSSSGGIN